MCVMASMHWCKFHCNCCSGVCRINLFFLPEVSREYFNYANASAGFKPIVDAISVAKTVAALFSCNH